MTRPVSLVLLILFCSASCKNHDKEMKEIDQERERLEEETRKLDERIRELQKAEDTLSEYIKVMNDTSR